MARRLQLCAQLCGLDHRPLADSSASCIAPLISRWIETLLGTGGFVVVCSAPEVRGRLQKLLGSLGSSLAKGGSQEVSQACAMASLIGGRSVEKTMRVAARRRVKGSSPGPMRARCFALKIIVFLVSNTTHTRARTHQYKDTARNA